MTAARHHSIGYFIVMTVLLVVTVLSTSTAIFFGQHPLKYGDIIDSAGSDYKVSSNLIRAVICAESKYNARAVSEAGAVGLMQILPSTASWCYSKMGGKSWDDKLLFDPKTNIDIGTYYLSYLITKFDSVQIAIVAYNAGEGNLSKWLIDDNYATNGKLHSIPFTESKNYLNRVLARERIYSMLNPQ